MPNYDRVRSRALRYIKGGTTSSGNHSLRTWSYISSASEYRTRAPCRAAPADRGRDDVLQAHQLSFRLGRADSPSARKRWVPSVRCSGVRKQARRSLAESIFKFLQKRRSLQGIESVVLSASFGVLHEEPREAEKWHRLLREMGAPRRLGAGYDTSPVLDPFTRQFHLVLRGHSVAIPGWTKRKLSARSASRSRSAGVG